MTHSKLATTLALSVAMAAVGGAARAATVNQLITFGTPVTAPFTLDADEPGIVPDSKCNGSDSEKPLPEG